MKITTIDKTRDDLALYFKERGYKTGAEIGVDRGLYSEVLCKSNPGVKLYCIDPWKIYKDNTDTFKMQSGHCLQGWRSSACKRT